MDNTGISNFGQQVPYDLRQVYAVEIVGESLKDIMAARKADNYPNHFKTMKDLWIVIMHRVKKKGLTYKDGNGKPVEAPGYYEAMVKKISEIARANPNEWLSSKGMKVNASKVAEIEELLAEFEIFIYEMIQSIGLFGGENKPPGL